MSQDIERFLDELTPRGPAPELRGRVLAAVGEESARVLPLGLQSNSL